MICDSIKRVLTSATEYLSLVWQIEQDDYIILLLSIVSSWVYKECNIQSCAQRWNHGKASFKTIEIISVVHFSLKRNWRISFLSDLWGDFNFISNKMVSHDKLWNVSWAGTFYSWHLLELALIITSVQTAVKSQTIANSCCNCANITLYVRPRTFALHKIATCLYFCCNLLDWKPYTIY